MYSYFMYLYVLVPVLIVLEVNYKEYATDDTKYSIQYLQSLTLKVAQGAMAPPAACSLTPGAPQSPPGGSN